MSPYKRLITYSIIQKGHAHARPFSFLLSAAQKPIYLTLLNSFIAPHSFSATYKGPILLLVKAAFWLLNKLSHLLLFLGGVPAGVGGKKPGLVPRPVCGSCLNYFLSPIFCSLKAFISAFSKNPSLLVSISSKCSFRRGLSATSSLLSLPSSFLSICLNISAPRPCWLYRQAGGLPHLKRPRKTPC